MTMAVPAASEIGTSRRGFFTSPAVNVMLFHASAENSDPVAESQRFVDVTRIDRQNVGSLRPVCLYQAGELRPFHTNPIVYRGTMYLTTSRSTIALDAVTCRVRWRHDWRPKARENWA